MTDAAEEQLLIRLRALFREELQDNVRLLGDGVRRLSREQRRDERAALVQELFRAAHSLKGAAHAAGVIEAVEPCHRLEDVLAELRAGHIDLDDTVLGSLDADIDALARFQDQLSTGPEDLPTGDHPGPVPPRDHPRPPPPAEPRARVAVAELDELLHEAGALVAAGRRLHLLTDALLSGSDPRARRRSPTSAEPHHDVELLARAAEEAADIERELSGAAARVAHSALHLRMQRFDDVTAGFDHVVRDLGGATGKQARMVLLGGDVELDREIGSALREPLLHLIRNAIHHGIEEPRLRSRAGKPPVGTVTVAASLAGARVRITVADDGAGVDVAALRSVAGDAELTPEAAVELAFQPGVSTSDKVDEVSGRGVGLDAVRARVESLGGMVQLRPGAASAGGVAVLIEVPVTLAVLRVLLMAVADEVVGLPAEAVRRLRRINTDELAVVEGRLLVAVGDEHRPALPLRVALDLPAWDGGADEAIIVELADEDSVLLVDRAVGEHEGLLQRLPARVASGMVIGAVLLPDDRVAPVVNPSTCLRVGSRGAAARPVAASARRRPKILLVEDTLTTRVLEHSILAGAGYEVLDAADGAEAWRLLGEHDVDLVVSDVDLPVMSGIDLCRAIRASARVAHLPVVLVTSLGSVEDRRRGAEAGANAYLLKAAFDQVTLLDAVRRLL